VQTAETFLRKRRVQSIHKKPYVEVHNVSKQAPDWFKVRDSVQEESKNLPRLGSIPKHEPFLDCHDASPESPDWFRTRNTPLVKQSQLFKLQKTTYDKPDTADPQNTSSDGPEWFNVRKTSLVKDSDVTKAPGYDGTITLLSRISGWITVSPRSRNRQKRLGRYGPFDKSKKGNNLRNVSDLAPAWMQTNSKKPQEEEFTTKQGYSTLRQDQKRSFLFDKEQPKRSVLSIGDYRHNVLTSQEANTYQSNLSTKPKNLLEWKEDVNRQKYDKPVATKVGQRFN